MTVVEFLEALYASPREWEMSRTGAIMISRSPHHSADCPVTYAVNIQHTSLNGPGAVKWGSVFLAADNRPGHNPKIRKALLHACGLVR